MKTILMKLLKVSGVLLFLNIFVLTPLSKASFLDAILDPIATFKQGMREWLSEIATSFATAAFEFLGEFIIAKTDISKIPQIETFIDWAQYSSATLVTFFLIKRVVEGMRDDLTGESEPNYAEILGSTIVSYALIAATPEIVKMFIRLNNMIVEGVTSLGIDVSLAGSDILDKYTVSGDLSLSALHIIFMSIIWAFSFLIFAIVGAIRYVELAIVLVMGPIAASTYTNRSQVFTTYWTEAIAVIFTQIVHVVLAFWIIQWSSEGTTWGMISSIASAVVSIKGPAVLKQFIYSSGTAGAVSGAGRMATYKMLLPKIK